MRRLAILLATWGGAGFSPVAPGTAGTLAAIPFFLLLALLPWWLYILCVVGIGVIACWAADAAERIFHEKDPHRVVVDEAVGFFITMTALPVTGQYLLAGFVFFRVFDIIKPFPIRLVERTVKGGYGIVLDDVVAGIYAHIALRIMAALALIFPGK
jgi:phosphatidylglycerophosphatase A